MQSWYYSKNGEQRGPVSLDELRSLVSSGGLNLQTDLGWKEGMTNWEPLGKIPTLLESAAPSSDLAAAPDSFNPYAAPTTSPDNLRASYSGGSLGEIEPGSVPLEVMNCIKRSIELTKRHFKIILPIGVVYLLLSMATGAVEGFVSRMVTGPVAEQGDMAFHPLLIPINLISAIVSVVLGAGLTRAALNIVSGKEAKVEHLFGETGKIVNIVAASFVFYIMVFIGLILLVVPGIYIAIRCSFFMTAIVDRNLGPIEALKYSYRITTNNTLSLFGLGIMSMLIVLAGVLALLIGLVFAIPVVTLLVPLAYRFLQFGPNALRDGATE
ncbi:MAG: DUF4339 domain-containing protein [Verrucomicrobiales bacterium]|nr:DUF4339 domain-containing protein [Verrucomicrobiales bacterium]MCP5560403.1 DUF4339 domain-containing protein [Verrucomicrobiaceae bacterium]